MKKRINKFVTISDDGTTVYEKFRWLVEWVAYCETLNLSQNTVLNAKNPRE